jgi:hypothetical protein
MDQPDLDALLLLEFSNNFNKLFAYGAFFNAFPKQRFQAGSGALQLILSLLHIKRMGG